MINSWGVVAAEERKAEVIEVDREWFRISGRRWKTTIDIAESESVQILS